MGGSLRGCCANQTWGFVPSPGCGVVLECNSLALIVPIRVFGDGVELRDANLGPFTNLHEIV